MLAAHFIEDLGSSISPYYTVPSCHFSCQCLPGTRSHLRERTSAFPVYPRLSNSSSVWRTLLQKQAISPGLAPTFSFLQMQLLKLSTPIGTHAFFFACCIHADSSQPAFSNAQNLETTLSQVASHSHSWVTFQVTVT